MKAATFGIYILVTCFAASLFAADTASSTAGSTSVTEKAAAAYLDGRLAWWMGWPTAARDHQTFCVSCHTVAPYAMSRPALRSALGEQSACPTERRLLDNVIKRVPLWKELAHFYPRQSRR